MIVADDFGLCAEVNEAICRLHDRGVVARTSLLVNTPFFEASVGELLRRPALEVAIHLNLTDGPPVLPAAEVPSLVDGSGRFAGGRHYGVVGRIAGGRMSRREIHREWRAQVARAVDAGLTLSELNAHGHLHLLPLLHGIVLDLQREFRLPGVRLVRSTEAARGRLLSRCSILLRRRLRRAGLPHAWPVRTCGLRQPGGVDPRIALADPGAARAPGVELIVHPASGPNPYHDRWGYRGKEVFEWLLASSDTH